jgi:hypothetical protein
VRLPDQSVEENVFLYLVYNQQRFKQELDSYVVRRDSLLKTEDSAFHSEIISQFEEYVRKVLTDNVTLHLGISTEDAIMVIENLNVDVYLRGNT